MPIKFIYYSLQCTYMYLYITYTYLPSISFQGPEVMDLEYFTSPNTFRNRLKEDLEVEGEPEQPVVWR